MKTSMSLPEYRSHLERKFLAMVSSRITHFQAKPGRVAREGAVMLLERLEEQAEFKADQDRRLTATRQRITAAPTNLQQKSEKLTEMRRKANAAEQELKLNRKLEMEASRLQKARVELYKGNLTARDRIELETNTANVADWASQYCKEAGSNWREEVRAAFGSQYQPPVNGRSSKRQ